MQNSTIEKIDNAIERVANDISNECKTINPETINALADLIRARALIPDFTSLKN